MLLWPKGRARGRRANRSPLRASPVFSRRVGNFISLARSDKATFFRALSFRDQDSSGSHGASRDVRFGSKADMTRSSRNVRFTPESGHRPAPSLCPVSARSRHPLLRRPCHRGDSNGQILKFRNVGPGTVLVPSRKYRHRMAHLTFVTFRFVSRQIDGLSGPDVA